ncbi:hypothetical protein CsSME_00049867 [Camellia sinensis var. sinensis]
MADIPGYVRACLQTGKLVFLAILVSGGIVLQVLACALYNNWWPMLTDNRKEKSLGLLTQNFVKLFLCSNELETEVEMINSAAQ